MLFRSGYVGCQLCTNRLSIQGFKKQGGSVEIDVAMDIDVSTLQSGCVPTSTTTRRRHLRTTMRRRLTNETLTLDPDNGQCTYALFFDALTTEAALPLISDVLANGGGCQENSMTIVMDAAKPTQADCTSPGVWKEVTSVKIGRAHV